MSAIVKRFQFSTTSCWCLEFGDTEESGQTPYLRFFTNGQQVEDSSGPYEIESPYAAADLMQLQFTQINDVAYITHPRYPVHKLTRITDTNWTLEECVFDVPAMLDENVSNTTFTLSNYTGTGVTLTATAAIFEAGHVGSYWRIGYKRTTGRLDVTIGSPVASNGYKLKGMINLVSAGTWTGTVNLERKNVAGAWEVVRQFIRLNSSGEQINHDHNAEEAAEYRINVTDVGSGPVNASVAMIWPDAIIYGTVKITAVGSGGTSATVDVVSTLYTQPDWTFSAQSTPYWAEGAWSSVRGYPRAVCLHESRLVFGGTTHQPSTIWGSAVEDFENFDREDTTDADSYVFTLAGVELNAVQWLASLGSLLCGTTGSEWRIIGDEYGAVITPTKVSARQFSYHGSEYVQAEMLGKTVVFVERKGLKLREITWDGEGFNAGDLMLLSDHLTEDGHIVQMAWQKDARILWVVTSDGRLFALTYNSEQAVLAAHRHTTAGAVRSVATIYGDTGAQDEVWVIAERTIGSRNVFYVEQMDPTNWEALEDAFYVDSGLSYAGTPVNQVGGADHLAGAEVAVLADGVPYDGITVGEDGTVTLPSGVTAAKWHVGLPYTSELVPYRLDADTQLGVHTGKTKHIDAVKVRVRRSCRFSYDMGGATFEAMPPEGTALGGVLGPTRAIDIPIPLTDMTNTTDPVVTIKQSNPLPLTVLALNIGYGVASG